EPKGAALLPLQRTVAIAQQQQQLWDSANKDNPGAMQQLDERKQQIDAGWQQTLSQMQAMSESAKKLAAAVIAPGKTNDKSNAGALYTDLVAENDKQRGEVVKLLTDAAKNFGEAATAAAALHQELQTRITEVSAKSPTAPE